MKKTSTTAVKKPVPRKNISSGNASKMTSKPRVNTKTPLKKTKTTPAKILKSRVITKQELCSMGDIAKLGLEQKVKEVFQLFDADGNGSIDNNEFQELAFALGETISDDLVEKFVQKLDLDGNGTISFGEFFEWWVGKEEGNDGDKGEAELLEGLKIRLQTEGLMRSVSNVLTKLQEERSASSSSSSLSATEEDFLANITVGVGNIDSENCKGSQLSFNVSRTEKEEEEEEEEEEEVQGVNVVFGFKVNNGVSNSTLDDLVKDLEGILESPIGGMIMMVVGKPTIGIREENDDKYLEIRIKVVNPKFTKALGMAQMIPVPKLELMINFSQILTDFDMDSDFAFLFALNLIVPSEMLGMAKMMSGAVQKKASRKMNKLLGPLVENLGRLRNVGFKIMFRDISDLIRKALSKKPPSRKLPMPLDKLKASQLKEMIAQMVPGLMMNLPPAKKKMLKVPINALLTMAESLEGLNNITCLLGPIRAQIEISGLELFSFIPPRECFDKILLEKHEENKNEDVDQKPSQFDAEYKNQSEIVSGSGYSIISCEKDQISYLALINTDPSPVEKNSVRLMKELAFFSDSVLKVVEVFNMEKSLVWVFEHPGSNLKLLASECQAISDETVLKKYLLQIVTLVNHSHFQGIWFRDLKIEDFLVDEKGRVFLWHCPFATRDYDSSEAVGIVHYMAPEMLLEAKYTKSVDVWALGNIAYFMLFNKAPFKVPGGKLAETAVAIQKMTCPFKINNISPSMYSLEFIKRCFKVATERATIGELVQNPWFFV